MAACTKTWTLPITAVPIRFNLEVVIRSDFADVFDVKAKRNVRRGHISSSWMDGQTLTTTYRNRDFVRAVAIDVQPADLNPVYANGRLSFEVRLAPAQTWHACLLYTFIAGDQVFPAPDGPCRRPGHCRAVARRSCQNPYQQ